MKNKLFSLNTFLYLVILVFFLGNYFYIKQNDKLRIKVLTSENAIQREKEINQKSFLRDLELSSTVNQIYLPHDKLFEAIKSGSYVLIYCYAGGECGKCIFEDLDKLQNFVLNGFVENVFVFPVFDSSREIEIKLAAELKNLSYARLNRNEVVLPSIKGNLVRFYAILTPEGDLTNLFFPDVLKPEKTDFYLQFIKEKYLN